MHEVLFSNDSALVAYHVGDMQECPWCLWCQGYAGAPCCLWCQGYAGAPLLPIMSVVCRSSLVAHHVRGMQELPCCLWWQGYEGSPLLPMMAGIRRSSLVAHGVEGIQEFCCCWSCRGCAGATGQVLNSCWIGQFKDKYKDRMSIPTNIEYCWYTATSSNQFTQWESSTMQKVCVYLGSTISDNA